MRRKQPSSVATRILAGILLTVVLAGCSGDATTTPASVADTPRYTAQQVSVLITRYGRDRGTSSYCSPSMPKYVGKGFWQCGRYQFDEQNGNVIPPR